MSSKDIPADLVKRSDKITSKDVDKVLSSEKKISLKSEALNILNFKTLFNQIKLTLEMLKDYRAKSYTDLPWKTITLLTVAVLYFLNPFDLIPDVLPVIGYGDDALAFAGVFKAVQSDLKKYCNWKGYDPEKYF
ncbi:hypothetical protein BH10BAC5_BH10BAC5_13060 [soil metagenome]